MQHQDINFKCLKRPCCLDEFITYIAVTSPQLFFLGSICRDVYKRQIQICITLVAAGATRAVNFLPLPGFVTADCTAVTGEDTASPVIASVSVVGSGSQDTSDVALMLIAAEGTMVAEGVGSRGGLGAGEAEGLDVAGGGREGASVISTMAVEVVVSALCFAVAT